MGCKHCYVTHLQKRDNSIYATSILEQGDVIEIEQTQLSPSSQPVKCFSRTEKMKEETTKGIEEIRSKHFFLIVTAHTALSTNIY